MKQLLGVDFGEKRVGVAVSDPTATIASPRGVIVRRSNRQVAEHVAELAREPGIVAVVLGLPLDSAGEEGYQARRVRRFADALRPLLNVPLVFWDESLSSVDASRALQQAGARRKRRAGPIDDVAAAVMLQAYLDHLPPSAS